MEAPHSQLVNIRESIDPASDSINGNNHLSLRKVTRLYVANNNRPQQILPEHRSSPLGAGNVSSFTIRRDGGLIKEVGKSGEDSHKD
jgi:hypothetical protein